MDCDKLKQEVKTMDNIKRNSLKKILSFISLSIDSFNASLILHGVILLPIIAVISIILIFNSSDGLDAIQFLAGFAYTLIFLIAFSVFMLFFAIIEISGIIYFKKIFKNKSFVLICILYNIISIATYISIFILTIYERDTFYALIGYKWHTTVLLVLFSIYIFLNVFIHFADVITGIKDGIKYLAAIKVKKIRRKQM